MATQSRCDSSSGCSSVRQTKAFLSPSPKTYRLRRVVLPRSVAFLSSSAIPDHKTWPALDVTDGTTALSLPKAWANDRSLLIQKSRLNRNFSSLASAIIVLRVAVTVLDCQSTQMKLGAVNVPLDLYEGRGKQRV